MADLWIFIGALAVAYIVPGPDMVLILQTSTLQGRSHALATACGLALARALHVALAALGLAALLRGAPLVFEIVRFAGAAYLAWLGITILVTRSHVVSGETQTRDRRVSYRAAASRGLLTNLLNPKALLFCSVLLPQFVQVGEGSAAGQFLLLGAILVGLGLTFDLIYAGTGLLLVRHIARRPAIGTLQRWTFATLLVLFGLRLALAHRPV